jgi:hypothetical protein
MYNVQKSFIFQDVIRRSPQFSFYFLKLLNCSVETWGLTCVPLLGDCFQYSSRSPANSTLLQICIYRTIIGDAFQVIYTIIIYIYIYIYIYIVKCIIYTGIPNLAVLLVAFWNDILWTFLCGRFFGMIKLTGALLSFSVSHTFTKLSGTQVSSTVFLITLNVYLCPQFRGILLN